MLYLARKRLAVIISTALLALNAFSWETPGRVDTIPRPELERLYRESDVVAFVKILSGDSENYDDVVYKSVIISSFKGPKQDVDLYFGPYSSYGVGKEYLVFLKDSKTIVGDLLTKDNSTRGPYDGSNKYYRIQFGGYSILPVSFECGFGPISATSNGCDDAVDARTVILPKEIESFPSEFGERSEAKPYVRKRAIVDFLKRIENR
jgi:hypothetical protein